MKIRNKHINESGLSLEDLEQIVNMLYPYDIQNNQHTQSNQPEQNFDFNNSEIPNTNNSNVSNNLEQPIWNQNNSKLNKTINSIDNLTFKNALLKVAQIHEQILDLYEYTLYEDNWTETTNKQFEDLLSEYNKNLDQLKSELPFI